MFMNTLWFACEHYLLHLSVSLAVYTFLYLIGIHLFLPFWILGTFIVDLDHLIDWFNPQDKTEKLIVEVLENKEMPMGRRIQLAVKDYWKKGFVHLLFHNLLFFVFVIILFFVFRENISALSFFGAIILHQIVDITGDIERWGNINNWLWKTEG